MLVVDVVEMGGGRGAARSLVCLLALVVESVMMGVGN